MVTIYIVIAAFLLWALVSSVKQFIQARSDKRFNKNYLVGINYLLNEEPDKAVDSFIKTLEVNADTAETHFALGNLFRRRGEVDRAIRVHENLLERPQLARSLRVQALLALGQDYLSYGMLDRAETIFLEEIKEGGHPLIPLQSLLDIYQQEKDWDKAIQIALKLSSYKDHMERVIAQHYCELAAIAQGQQAYDQALQYLNRSLAYDGDNSRANLMKGQVHAALGQFEQAIKFLQRIETQSPDYIGETLKPLEFCYESLGQRPEFVAHLKKLMQSHPSVDVMRVLACLIQRSEGDPEAIQFVTHCTRQYPSLWSVDLLIDYHLSVAQGSMKNDLKILKELTKKLLLDKPAYECQQCGFSGNHLEWQCRRCKHWGEMKPINIE